MKKSLKITFALVLIPFVAIIAWLCVVFPRPVKLDFTEKITLGYVYADKDIHVEIADKDDFAQLISICEGPGRATFELPACGFGAMVLIFEGRGKQIAIYPACDRCGTMRLGEKDKYFYSISDKDRLLLEDILAKYGVTFPCV